MAQVFSQIYATLATVAHLELKFQLEDDRGLEGTDGVEWLHLLHQFAMQTLHVSWELSWLVDLALKGITAETVAEVLPSLDLICLESGRCHLSRSLLLPVGLLIVL